jgi:hypothetical protein
MTADERETIFQFLAGNWYDREEEDDEIVAEYVNLATPEEARQAAAAVAAALGRVEDRGELAALVRRAAWRWFPDETEAPIAWLREVRGLLEAEIAQREGHVVGPE